MSEIKTIGPSPTDKPVEKKKKARPNLPKFAWAIGAIVIGLVLGWVILLATGSNPVDYYGAILDSNFGSGQSFGNFVGAFSWLLPLGIAVLVSFRAKLFNIGVAGQMMAGGIAGYFVAVTMDIGRAGMIFTILVPIVTGMAVGWMIALLKTRFKIHEVISSIMLNWIVFWLYKFVTTPGNINWIFDGGTQPKSIPFDNSLKVDWLSDAIPNSTINIGIIIVLVAIILIFLLYRYTSWGYKQDIMGNSMSASSYIGINKNHEISKAMLLSGAFAGLAGSIFYFGVNNGVSTIGSDIPGHAFNGITIALLGFNTPVGILLSTVFVSTMNNAEILVSGAGIDPKISDLILGIIIFISALTTFFIIYRPQDKWIAWLNRRDIKSVIKQESAKNATIDDDGGSENKEGGDISNQKMVNESAIASAPPSKQVSPESPPDVVPDSDPSKDSEKVENTLEKKQKILKEIDDLSTTKEMLKSKLVTEDKRKEMLNEHFDKIKEKKIKKEKDLKKLSKEVGDKE